MSLQIGIVGLPNVGRARSSTPHPGRGAVALPLHHLDPTWGGCPQDERLDWLAAHVQPERWCQPRWSSWILPGWYAAPHRGGLGNQFLHHIRNVDAVALVVRGFLDADITSREP